MRPFLCVSRLLLGAVLGSLAFVGGSLAASGGVSWFSPPRAEPNGWYWMYDDAEAGPPFIDPLLPPPPSYRSLHDDFDASKLAPYNDQPFKYTLPDSFWYYGHWYDTEDYLYISTDGWVSLDPDAAPGYPDPPTASPPFPVTDAPNAVIAPLWQDMDPTQTPYPSDDNRVYYRYDKDTSFLIVEWYKVQGHATENEYTFEAVLRLGGQKRLISQGECGVTFSHHLIHFLYEEASAGWAADGGKTGIENPTGTMGITYGGSLVNGRVIRTGYKRLFKHDVQAYVFLSPGETVLRWTEIEPRIIIRNIGEEVEHFPVSVDIYDENDSLVYAHTVSGFSLMPGQYDTMVCPCWVPGEIGQEYRKVAYPMLDRDECSHNDTLEQLSYVHCEDTLRYPWAIGCNQSRYFPLYNERVGTFYWVNNGVLVTGARVWVASLIPDGAPPKIELWEAANGCGGIADGATPKASEITETYWAADWHPVSFGPDGRGVWVNSAEPGNIWVAVTSSAEDKPTDILEDAGLESWPGDYPCYLGPGPGRGGIWNGSPASEFQWGSYWGDYFTPATELFVHLGFGDYPLSPKPSPPCYYEEPHDLSCYQMTEPRVDYVEADVPITPEIAIANIGRQAEPDAEFFEAGFIAVNEETSDTVFHETTLVDQTVGWPGNPADDPDTLYAITPPWTPEGFCDDSSPFVYYELIGIVRLGEVGPDYSDHCPYNDTVRHNVTCLLSHDVGVIHMTWPEPPDEPPDRYDEGSKITVTATVENFGYHAEHDVEVRMEVRDLDSNDVLLWHTLKSIDFLNWRGNGEGEPYTTEVTFPTYDVLNEHHFCITCRTELEDDDCPDNDYEVRYIGYPGIAEEGEALPDCFTLEIPGSTISAGCQVRFAVPHQSLVKLDVFDAGGRWVCSLENDIFEPGRHSCSWDRCDACGRKVAAGIYLVRMQADGFSDVRKIVIIN